MAEENTSKKDVDGSLKEEIRRGGKEEKERVSGNKLIIVLISCVVLIAILAAVIIVLVTKEKKAERVETALDRGVITESNVNDVVEAVEEENKKEDKVKPGDYEVSQYLEWTFDDAADPSTKAYVFNKDTNTNPVCFDLSLRETGEILYQSPVIPLGEGIDSVTLNRDLDPGTYDCIITYYLLDEQNVPLSELSLGMTITVAK